jgi:hypothetical protein
VAGGGNITKFPGSLIGPATTIGRPYPLPDGSQGTDLYLTRQAVASAFAADVSPQAQDQIFATQRPFSVDAFNSQSGVPAWKTIPSWYLVTTQDKAIPPGDATVHGEPCECAHQRSELVSRCDVFPPGPASSTSSLTQ